MPHNIEKSGFHRGEYVGYGQGTTWKIYREGKWWKALPRDSNLKREYASSLTELSKLIESSAAPRPATVLRNRRFKSSSRDEKSFKPGDKVTVAKAGHHSLVVGALARVREVYNNGVAALDVQGATAHVPVKDLRHTRPGDAAAWRNRTDLPFSNRSSRKKRS